MLFRLFLFFCGLGVMSTGIAMVTNAGLGTGTISSVAFVLNELTGQSMGFYVFLTNVFFFVIQVLVEPKGLLGKAIRQLPICFVFGILIDAGMWLTGHIVPQAYWQQILMAFAGTFCTGAGIACLVFARLAILPPEGLVIAVLHRFGGSFGTIKMMIDIFLLVVTVITSLLTLDTIVGVREGTFITAICSGPIAKVVLKLWARLFPAHSVID